MSKVALVRLGPIAAPQNLLSGISRERTLYDRMRLADDAPVIVDHDGGREVGRVLELSRLDDGEGLWLAARCELDEAPPWLKRGTPASFAFATLARGELNGFEIVREGLVNEVSLLSSARRPAEPLARVVLLRDGAPTQTPGAYADPAYAELWRRVDAGERFDDVVADIQGREAAAAYERYRRQKGILVRNFGKVIAVGGRRLAA